MCDEDRRVAAALAELRPGREGASVEVRGGPLWPPMELTRSTADLARQAAALAAELGFELGSGHAGGRATGVTAPRPARPCWTVSAR